MSKAAKRYARAFFELASTEQDLDTVRADVQAIRKLCSVSSEFQQFVKDPVLPTHQQQAVIRDLLEGKAHPLTLRFLLFLIHKKRLAELDLICQYVEEFYCEKNNIVKVTVTSASSLSDDQLSDIQKRLESRFSKTIDVTPRIDPALLGGFKIQIGDTIHDYTIQAQLHRLREKLINA